MILLRTPLFLGLLLGVATEILAQTNEADSLPKSEAIADSAMRASPDLFEGIAPTPPPLQSVPNWMLHSPLQRSLPVIFVPEMRELIRATEPRTLPGYNRADGFVIGFGAPRGIPIVDSPRILGDGGIAYAFGSHYWQGRAGITAELGAGRIKPLRLRLEGHHITDTRDSWRSADFETSLAAAVAGIDHRDYFQRSGFSFGLRWFAAPTTSVHAELTQDEYRSLPTTAAWSLFGPDNPFGEVARVTEGRERTLSLGVQFDHLGPDDLQLSPLGTTPIGTTRRTTTRWGVASTLELGEMEGKRFFYMVADAQLHTEIVGPRLRLGFHLRTGVTGDNAPLQRLFTVGGIGALAAWPYRFEVGERTLLFESDLLFTFCPECRSSILRELTLIFSNDIGGAWSGPTNNPNAPFPPSIKSLLYGPTLSLGTYNGDIRVGYAVRTDGGGDGRWVVRIITNY